jgi:hypothetical protein
MKRSLFVFTAMLACACAGQLWAQDDYQPYSDYDYYSNGGAIEQPSPSDLPETPPMEQPAMEAEYGSDSFMNCGCAGDCCCDEPWRLFPELPCGFNLNGWVDSGGTANADSPASRYNGPVVLNDRDEFMMNQLYTVLERPIDTNYYCFDMGARVDLLYGTDYLITQAVGLETHQDGSPKWNNERFYGLAMPQAYVQLGWLDLDVKIGHFYAPVGYEGVMAANNFFYSRSYAFGNAAPFTFSGILANYKLTDQFNTFVGVHNGWNVFDRFTERAGLMSGFGWTNYDETFKLNLGMTTGDELNNAGVYGTRTMYSIVAVMKLTERLDYVIQHDLGWQDDFFAPDVDAEWYGINQHMYYTINPCWKLGGRFEWFRDDDGVRVTGLRPDNPVSAANGGSFVGNFYEATLGLNWIPTNNLRVRPEVRWDWFDGVGLPYDDATKDNQFLAAVDAVLLW